MSFLRHSNLCHSLNTVRNANMDTNKKSCSQQFLEVSPLAPSNTECILSFRHGACASFSELLSSLWKAILCAQFLNRQRNAASLYLCSPDHSCLPQEADRKGLQDRPTILQPWQTLPRKSPSRNVAPFSESLERFGLNWDVWPVFFQLQGTKWVS